MDGVPLGLSREDPLLPYAHDIDLFREDAVEPPSFRADELVDLATDPPADVVEQGAVVAHVHAVRNDRHRRGGPAHDSRGAILLGDPHA